MVNIAKLLKTLRDALTLNIKTLGLVVIAGLLLGAILFGCHQDSTVKSYEQKVAQWKHTSDSLSLANDSLIVRNKTLTDINTKTLAWADSVRAHDKATVTTHVMQRRKADSTLTVLQQTLPDTCKAALTLSNTYREQADSLLVALNNEFIRGDSLKVLDDSLVTQNGRLLKLNTDLDTQLHLMPVYKAPKLLGLIPYPSRKQSYVVGIASGILVTMLATHQLH